MLLVVVVLEIQVFPDNSHSKGFPKFVDVSSRQHKNKKLCCFNNIIYAVVLDFTKGVYFIKHVLFSLISNTVHQFSQPCYKTSDADPKEEPYFHMYIYSSASYFNKLLTYIPTVTDYKKKLIPMLFIDLLFCLREVFPFTENM